MRKNETVKVVFPLHLIAKVRHYGETENSAFYFILLKGLSNLLRSDGERLDFFRSEGLSNPMKGANHDE